jgi:hypothetical protein
MINDFDQFLLDYFAGAMSPRVGGGVYNGYGDFVPYTAEEEELFVKFTAALREAMVRKGLDLALWRFRAYHVVSPNPFRRGRLKLPDQVVVLGPNYKEIHDAVLLVLTPWVAAEEFRVGQ